MKKRFIFDENYIKRYAKKDKVKWLVICVSVLILIFLVIIVMIANKNRNRRVVEEPAIPSFELKEELVLESGSPLPEVVDYFEDYENIDIQDIKITYPDEFEISYDTSLCSDEEIAAINESDEYDGEVYSCAIQILKNPTTYGITIEVLEEEYTVNLVVQDTTAPIIITKDVEIYESEEYVLEDFVSTCFDVTSECNIKYYMEDADENMEVIDYSAYTEPGEYTVKLVAEDDYGNISKPFEAKLTISEVETTLYTITFDSNGGSEVSSILVIEGGSAVAPSAPTRDGYNFLGWYQGDKEFDFTTAITGNITLTAKWEKINTSGSGGSSGGSSTVSVSSISLSSSKVYIYVDGSTTVKATVKPSNATNKTVTWKSNNTSIAKVKNGKITGVKAGTTTITATAGGKSATVTVVVKEKPTTTTTCTYGDTAYNTSYILSVNLTSGGCAVNPNLGYNETVATTDKKNLETKLASMGYVLTASTFQYRTSYVNVKNNAGTGLVGYQITVNVNVIEPTSGSLQSAQYIIKSDGSRQFTSNGIQRNGVKLS